ncbi:hypothetical protein [Halostreptopolyspora alba]|uniref:Uncharacterized protein n=1 Tax=Halostreptopolyspora alba TaxID=2487137 RepID=A0A3N0EIA9_9ACTN|nr:hypothetical protein EFW17_02130 [Nocardiopsaceae bacterium YIM 96095]
MAEARRALADPDATEMVEGVTRGFRWGHQVEERGWFLTSLVAAPRIDLARTSATDLPDPPDRWGADTAWLPWGPSN